MPASLAISTLETLLRDMLRIRAFEDAAEIASRSGIGMDGQRAATSAQVRGPLHLSIGQEAVPVGVCAHLLPGDYLTSTHRDHGHTLAQGANGVVTAGLPIAVGAAHGQKLQGKDGITACFFGDGAIDRGPFLESLNWAKVYALPVLFVCEDNRWSATTANAPMTAGEGASARAVAMGVPAVQVDGNDVEAVHATAGRLVAELRGGAGPCLLHARTYRIRGHVSVDAGAYRDPAALAAARETDPIARACARYLALGGSARALQKIQQAARDEVELALEQANAAPWPELQSAYADVRTTGAGRWY